MFCPNCGSQMANDTAFCPSCGTRVSPAASPRPAQNGSGAPFTVQMKKSIGSMGKMRWLFFLFVGVLVFSLVFSMTGVFKLKPDSSEFGAAAVYAVYAKHIVFLPLTIVFYVLSMVALALPLGIKLPNRWAFYLPAGASSLWLFIWLFVNIIADKAESKFYSVHFTFNGWFLLFLSLLGIVLCVMLVLREFKTKKE